MSTLGSWSSYSIEATPATINLNLTEAAITNISISNTAIEIKLIDDKNDQEYDSNSAIPPAGATATTNEESCKSNIILAAYNSNLEQLTANCH